MRAQKRIKSSGTPQNDTTTELTNPYEVFPEELWLLIIKAAKQSALQNLFQTFPKFFDTFWNHVTILEFRPKRNDSYMFKPKPTSPDIPDVNKLVNRTWSVAVEHFVKDRPRSNFWYILPTSSNTDKPLALTSLDRLDMDLSFPRIFNPKVQRHLRIRKDQNSFVSEEECELDFNINKASDIYALRNCLATQYIRSVTVKPRHEYIYVSEVITWMATSAYNVTELIIENGITPVIFSAYERIPTVPCVKYLRIADSEHVSYRFLQWFTSMGHLHIIANKATYLKNLKSCGNQLLSYDRLTNLVRNYLYQEKLFFDSQQSDLWNELPSLKSFVLVDKGMIFKHYVRSLGNTPLIFQR